MWHNLRTEADNHGIAEMNLWSVYSIQYDGVMKLHKQRKKKYLNNICPEYWLPILTLLWNHFVNIVDYLTTKLAMSRSAK